jgi:GDP-D-mannose dehydratase
LLLIYEVDCRGKIALINGITGQDGAFQSRLLLDKGYEVFGTLGYLSSVMGIKLILGAEFGRLPIAEK